MTREIGNGEALGGTPPGISGPKLALILDRDIFMHCRNQVKLYLANLESTQEFGQRLGRTIQPDTVLALTGEIGSGKTTLVKAIAKGLSVEEVVTSPTFVLMNEYHTGRLPLYHVDLYRLMDEPDQSTSLNLLTAQLAEVLNSKAVVIIEWAEIFLNRYSQDLNRLCANGYLSLNLTADISNNQARLVTMSAQNGNEKNKTTSFLFENICQLSKDILV